MDNTKDDIYYLEKMLKDIRFIISKTEGITVSQLKSDEVLCDSVLFRLIQISENSTKLSDEFKTVNRDIPWQAIKGMRNRIVHEYGNVDLSVVYQTITEDIPQILQKLDALLCLM